MTYSTIADMTESPALRRRLTAAAAQEGKTKPYETWVHQFIWEIASSPGWDTAWESAIVNGGGPDPGGRADVITDAMILAVVQPLDVPPEA